MAKIYSVGECMIELARRSDGVFEMRVGGDTFNTAIYLARFGADVEYVTAVGDDPYSAEIRAAAQRENVGMGGITTVAGRMPGLYLIETQNGERSFWYWRDRSPARELLELHNAERTMAALAAADVIYLSGITLSLYSQVGLDRLAVTLTRVRKHGGLVVMDGNYRPAGWNRDTIRARAVYERFWRLTDIALPSFDDEQALWNDQTPDDVFQRFANIGVGEVCIKLAQQGAIISTTDGLVPVPPEHIIAPVDSTAAGDSFSAAYLFARLKGRSPCDAATLGNRLAAIVIGHPGAIAPVSATVPVTGQVAGDRR